MTVQNGVSVQGAIDADGHILEPPDLWETYLEPRYRDRAIRIRTGNDGLEYFEFDGKPSQLGVPGFPGLMGAMGDDDLTPLGKTTQLKDLPSNHFRRQCWISADPDERALPWIIEHVGTDRFFWASDYPHADHTSDYMEDLRQLITPLSETARRQMLWENVSRVYKLGQ